MVLATMADIALLSWWRWGRHGLLIALLLDTVCLAALERHRSGRQRLVAVAVALAATVIVVFLGPFALLQVLFCVLFALSTQGVIGVPPVVMWTALTLDVFWLSKAYLGPWSGLSLALAVVLAKGGHAEAARGAALVAALLAGTRYWGLLHTSFVLWWVAMAVNAATARLSPKDIVTTPLSPNDIVSAT
jgi:hypothetical protein